MEDELHLDFCSLSLTEVRFEITLEGVFKHISQDRVKLLDRLARFQEYGYTTTD